MANGWTAAKGALFLIITYLILISGCISPSNSLFLSFIWRNVARTVNRFGLLTVRANFSTLPLLKDGEWLNCFQGCFVSYHDLPEFWYLIAELPLLHCCSVLSVEMLPATHRRVALSANIRGANGRPSAQSDVHAPGAWIDPISLWLVSWMVIRPHPHPRSAPAC